MKKLLFIAYYFPPLGMGGVQRAAKFVKYLPESGWHPVVLTVKDMPYYARDDSLLEELKGVDIERTVSLDPPHLLGKFKSGGSVPSASSSALAELNTAISSLLFIPDNKVGWVYHAYTRAKSLIANQHFDAILTTSPPHSSHIIGYLLKRKFKIPWIADFRDNWFDDYYRKGPTPLHTTANRMLAKHLIRHADSLIAVSEPISRALRSHGAGGCVNTIYNGFDREDFEEMPDVRTSKRLTITYAGTLNKWLNPAVFFKAVALAVSKQPALRNDLSIQIIGTQIGINAPQMAKKEQISGLTTFFGYLGHRACLKCVLASQMLLLIIPDSLSSGMVTGKVFEYLAAYKPILALVPPGEARELILKLARGVAVHPGDLEAIAKKLIRAHELWKRGDLHLSQPRWKELNRYDRREQTKKLAGILNDVIPAR